MTFFLGLILTIGGFFMVAKSEWLLNNFGTIPVFDKFIPSYGGSRMGYKLIGCTVIFFGILIMTGLIGPFLLWVFSPLLKQSVVPENWQ